MSYHVEFFGPPGVGKTYLARAVSQWAQQRNISRASIYDPTIYAPDPTGVTHWVSKLADRVPESVRERFMRSQFVYPHSRRLARSRFIMEYWPLVALVVERCVEYDAVDSLSRFLDAGSRYILLREQRVSLTVGDDLLVQAAGALLFDTAVSADWASEYMGLAPHPELVFGVSAPPQLCAKRLAKRGTGHRRYQSMHSRSKQMVSDFTPIAQALQSAIERRGVPIMSVDNGNGGSGVGEVRGALEAILGGSVA